MENVNVSIISNMEKYLIIILFNIILFFRTFKYELAVDDNEAFRHCQNSKHWNKTTLHGYFTRLSSILYGAGLFKDHKKDHIFTTFLVTLFSCLLYVAFGNIWVSLLWSSHPINNQVTIWLNGRRYLISLILALVAYIFPSTGFILFPLALWFHPVSIAMFVAGLIKTPVALTWLIPCFLVVGRYKHWINQRWSIQNFEEYKKFNIGKISLAVRCMAEYWLSLLFPTGFTMYHKRIWGIAELDYKKKENYAFDLSFWIFISVISSILVIGLYCDCIIWAILANIAVFQWCGIWKSPTQLWAQRYASLFSVFGLVYLTKIIGLFDINIQNTILFCILTWYVVITMKDMGMYRNVYTFFFHHVNSTISNQNAHYFATVGLNNFAVEYFKEKNKLNALMCDAFSMAFGFHWVLHNKKNDLIHSFMKEKINGKNKKINYEEKK